MKEIFSKSGVATAFSMQEAAADDELSPIQQDVMALFDELRQPLLRYLASFALPVADAEEIVQDTFLALFQHLQRGRPRHQLKGWLFRVAHNLALRRRRDDRRECVRRSESAIPADHAVIDPRPDPEREFVAKQRQQTLVAVVNALSDQDQRCLYLRAEGLRYRDIAEILGLSISTVSVSLARSLARIFRATQW